MVQEKQCYDSATYPKALDHFMDDLSDQRLGDAIISFTPALKGPVLKGEKYTHHIDHEHNSSDKKWQYFSVAPDSGGTKESRNTAYGETRYVCYIGIANELFDNVPAGFGGIVREAFARSRNTVNTTVTRYILADGTICNSMDDAEAEKKKAEDKKNAPTHAPNGKPYWDYATMGNPTLPEHFTKYETRKPKAARNKRN